MFANRPRWCMAGKRGRRASLSCTLTPRGQRLEIVTPGQDQRCYLVISENSNVLNDSACNAR